MVKEVNTLRFDTYASYLSGLNKSQLYLVSNEMGTEKFGKINFYGEKTILFSIGFIVFSSLISLILYIHSKRKETTYIYSGLATLLIGIYFMDYLSSEFIILDYLLYKKSIMTALFLGVGFYSLAISSFFENRVLKYIAIITMIGIILMDVLTINILQFKSLYTYWYMMVLLNMVFWIVSVIKNLKTHRQAFIYLMGFVVGLIFAASAIISDLTGSYFSMNSPIIYLATLATVPLLLAYETIKEINAQIIHEKSMREIDFIKSITDELTGTWNQRYLFIKLKEQEPLYTISMIDIDDFKAINDSFGHPAGDYVLKMVTHDLQKWLSASDVLCRYGGDEFVLITYDYTEAEIYELMDLFRDYVDKNPFVYHDVKIHVTLSIGIYTLKETLSSEEILHHVDDQLYYSKTTGKNMVRMYIADDK